MCITRLIAAISLCILFVRQVQFSFLIDNLYKFAVFLRRKRLTLWISYLVLCILKYLAFIIEICWLKKFGFLIGFINLNFTFSPFFFLFYLLLIIYHNIFIYSFLTNAFLWCNYIFTYNLMTDYCIIFWIVTIKDAFLVWLWLKYIFQFFDWPGWLQSVH